jgi:propanol-preferring alcohol dehydrogenase
VPQQQNGGYSVDGSFGEYMLVDERYAARIPDGADPVEVAPILCAGVTVYKGLKMTGVRPGEWVTISGIGGLGHIAVQYARAMGMRVAAVDVDDAKLELARRHGAEVTVNAATTDPGEAIQAATGGTHGVLVTAVHPRAFDQALRSCAAARRSSSTACRRAPSTPTSSTSCCARSRSAARSSGPART